MTERVVEFRGLLNEYGWNRTSGNHKAVMSRFEALLSELHESECISEQLLAERDTAEEWADKLAYALYTVEDIGEHSNLNNPWANALERIQEQPWREGQPWTSKTARQQRGGTFGT